MSTTKMLWCSRCLRCSARGCIWRCVAAIVAAPGRRGLPCGVIVVVVIQRLARNANHWRRSRRGWARWICCGQNNHGRGKDDRNDGTGDTLVMTTTKLTTTADNHITYSTSKKHIICLIFFNSPHAVEAV